MAITAQMRTDVANLYVALFGRAPERDGLGYWVNQIDSGKTLAQIAQDMYNTDPARAYYPTFLTNEEIIGRFYTNVLGRTADADGLAYWTAKLNAGQTQGAVIAEMITAVTAYTGTDTAALTSQTLFNNKVEVSLYYAVTLGGNDVTKAAAVLSGVTDSAATVVAAKESAATSAGSTFTLTSAADTGTSFTGTSGNDVFVGQISGDMATGTTLNAGDALSGAAGTDTLTVSVAGASTAAVTSTAVTLTGVEKVLVSNFDSNTDDTEDTEFNGSLWSGVTTVGLTSSASTGDTSFTSLANIVSAEMASGAADLSVSYVSSVVSGTADTQALALNGVTAGTFTADTGIETVAITSASTATKSTLTALSATGATKLTIDADAALTISGTLDTNIKTIDASASAAGVALSLGTANLTVTGGAGNDRIRIDGSTVDTNDTINAGDGTDVLELTAATNVTSSTNGAKLVGFETVNAYRSETFAEDGATATTVAQDVSLLGSTIATVGVTSFAVAQSAGAGGGDDETIAYGANYTNLAAGTNMALSGFSVTDASTGAADDGLIINFTATADLKTDNTSGDAITVTLGSSTAGMATLGTQTGGTQDSSTAFNLTLALDDYETVTLASQGGSNTVASLTSGDMTKLVVNATKALTVSAGTWANLATIDASASTADVSIAATTKASTITGGAGNDTFTGSGSADSVDGGAGNDVLSGGSGVDTILGGAGNDNITGGGGNDKLYGGDGDDTFADGVADDDYVEGGAGNDTITVATFSTLTSADTISGGDGTDTIAIAENGNIDFTADITNISNVTGIERFSFTGLAGNNDTVTINDGVVSTAGGTLTLVNASNSSTTWDGDAVLSNASKVVYTQSSSVTAAQTFLIGNGVESVTLGTGGDTVTVSKNVYLSTSDTLVAGTGSDTLSLTDDTVGTTTHTSTTLANISGFETISINSATDAATKYVFTLNDTLVGNQIAAGSTFTITRASNDTAGTLKVDGSAVTSTYNLALTGGGAADTLIGGAGNDTITLSDGADSVTGGAGNDTFVGQGTVSGVDRISDFSFGTSSTTADVIDLQAVATITALTLTDGAIFRSATDTIAAGDNIWVLDAAAYADADAVETAVDTLAAATATGGAIIVWQDTLGKVHVSTDTAVETDNTGFVDSLILEGLTITGISSLINATDFVV